MTNPIWRPSAEHIAASNMQRFIERVGAQLATPDYASLHAWSVNDLTGFWRAAWDFFEVRATTPYASVVDGADAMPGTRWFDGARLNFAENLLKPEHDGIAVIAYDETGRRGVLSRAELASQVASIAHALSGFGVGPGDRVAGVLPNGPQTVVAMLATASLGAVWSACSPDFGTDGLVDRLGLIDAKVLFATDGYRYNGKRIDCLEKVAALRRKLGGLEQLVLVPNMNTEAARAAFPDLPLFDDLLAVVASLRFTPVPFAHPLYILYSSGTTGAPKGIVHSVGGTLLQHQKEHILHTDIKPGDAVFYFTTCGWMMWHWLVSSLASGATIVLYDGAPFHPGSAHLWQMAEREHLAVFGTSAGYLSALAKSGFSPARHFDLDELKAVLSTGSPLSPASFDFVYAHIKKDVQLASVAGGSDLISCFALGNPILPVYRGELQCRGLGMDVAIFDDRGRAVTQQKGELVCRKPFPSMPVSFWNDPDGSSYRKAYFERFANVWHHGDYAEITEHDGVVIYGRSDAVLNPRGVRIGTAEIYRVVDQFAEIAESIVVGQEWDDDVRVVLFVRMQPESTFDSTLVERIERALREKASPRHVPAIILDVPDIPRTISGKAVEIAVREVIHGREISNIDALANPHSLEHFKNRAELAQ